MKSLLLSISLILISTLSAQNINENFEKWPVIEEAINITGIALSPDGEEVALVGGRMEAIFIYDYKSREVIRKIPIEKDYQGYNIFYSAKGNYLILQERVTEKSTKKSREADFAIVDLNQGKVIHDFNRISDAKITPDEKQLITLEKNKVTIRDLNSGKELSEFKAEDATNALAVSPDGKHLAIVKKPSKKEVAMMIDRKVKKKVIKQAAKTKFLISIYDKESEELVSIVPEFYDNISLLYYMQNGEKLLSFNIAQNSYVNVALPKEDYQPSREGYLGRSSMQPDFSYSADGKYFGIATLESFPSVNIYKVETNSIVDKYDTKMKIWKNIKKNIFAGTNTSFVFLPDENHVLIAYGNSLIKWRFEKGE
jgi:WD40 repeat protein